jgi:hypothetical protein
MNPAGERSAKAAFEIGKGPRQVMTLSESDVERCLDPRELLDGLEDGFRGLELGEVQSPPAARADSARQGILPRHAVVAPGN